MAQIKNNLKPQDVAILVKIIVFDLKPWSQETLAFELQMSQSEISQSLNRCRYATLIDADKKKVNRFAFTEFLLHGIQYVFPQQPGAIVRGIPTAHSAPPLNNFFINSQETFVWPHHRGTERGQAVEPLYPAVVNASLMDNMFYEYMTLIDALRVGRAREKEIAKKELRKRILHEE
ncbi:hypothetical protein HNP37_004476 [Flavobacterium nitrogenifigens]|uniref:Uncharacterized protein n=2 Tax=Flavobacterium TaxID=237 RepID=A0A7W7J186_9FLAO|nr:MULTISPECIES: hypothetical protein [Flavobacterium]MBB4804389.1 hypothetical protein [Flavobacterium nitrogenifigens]MBB6389215.1 hypothetical protein [Flavobacterium notoginsengisoli]